MNQSMRIITVYNTGKAIACEVVNAGLARHSGGRHQQMYAREIGTDRYYRTNRAGRYTLCRGHTLAFAKAAFGEPAGQPND